MRDTAEIIELSLGLLKNSGHENPTLLQEPQILQGGRIRSTYLLYTSAGDFVASVFEPYDNRPLPAQATHGLQQRLCFMHAAVPEVIGDLATTSDGRGLALVRFKEGRHYSSLCAEKASTLGKEMAKLHVTMEKTPLSSLGVNNIQMQTPPYLRIMKSYLRHIWDAASKGKFASAALAIENMAGIVNKRLFKKDIPRQMIHGDITPTNILFANDNKPIFIDWEKAYPGSVLDDISSALVNLIIHPHVEQPAHVKKAINAFMASYEAIRPLSDAEIEALPVYVNEKTGQMAVVARQRFNLGPLNEGSKLLSQSRTLMNEMAISIADRTKPRPAVR